MIIIELKPSDLKEDLPSGVSPDLDSFVVSRETLTLADHVIYYPVPNYEIALTRPKNQSHRIFILDSSLSVLSSSHKVMGPESSQRLHNLIASSIADAFRGVHKDDAASLVVTDEDAQIIPAQLAPEQGEE